MIFNIAKANIEIERLKAALKEAGDKLSALEAKTMSGSCTCSCEACADCEQKDDSEASKKHKHHALADAVDDLSALLQGKDAEIATLKAEHQKALDEKEADVEKRASAKAAAITAGQGQPALTIKPEDTPAKPVPFPELKGLDRAIVAHKSSVNYH